MKFVLFSSLLIVFTAKINLINSLPLSGEIYINNKISNNLVTVDLLWPDFIQIILELFQEDIELHEKNYQV